MSDSNIKEIKMNIAGKKLGRVASEIAMTLMGKDMPDYTPNKVANVKVVVGGVDELAFTDKKLSEKEYQRYSGYPGGRKVFNMAHVVESHGAAEVLRKAVYGMLPANKLRKLMMKNLIIK
jgi:large subunit ribosomal protein L13